MCSSARPAGYVLTIHPGAEIQHHIPLPQEATKSGFAGNLYVCGTVSYVDDVSPTVYSEFCFYLTTEDLYDWQKLNRRDHTICSPALATAS